MTVVCMKAHVWRRKLWSWADEPWWTVHIRKARWDLDGPHQDHEGQKSSKFNPTLTTFSCAIFLRFSISLSRFLTPDANHTPRDWIPEEQGNSFVSSNTICLKIFIVSIHCAGGHAESHQWVPSREGLRVSIVLQNQILFGIDFFHCLLTLLQIVEKQGAYDAASVMVQPEGHFEMSPTAVAENINAYPLTEQDQLYNFWGPETGFSFWMVM